MIRDYSHRALGMALCLAVSSAAFGQSAPPLGAAGTFAVLGASTVTSTGLTVITGDLGVSPGTAVTGFGPGVVSGTIHSAGAVALQAQTAALAAYNDAASQPCTVNLTGQNLGGLTLTPGVYCFASSAQLTGTLTLDALGSSNAVFIFQIGSTLTTATSALVSVVNAGLNCNVYWQVGSSATLGTATTLAGNILALASITATTGARVFGRALALNGAVTLDTNAIDASCPAAPVPPPVCPTGTLAPATLPNGTVGTAYDQTFVGSGGLAPYGFTLSAGAVPGLSLTPQGALAGLPTSAGAFSLTVRATDANGCNVERSYTVTIAAVPVPPPDPPPGPPPVPPPAPPPGCPAVTIAPATLPGATQGVAFEQQLTASGGTLPYVFAITSGGAPAGLTLTGTGQLAGTPSVAGTPVFTVRGTDTDGCFQELVYALTVLAPVPTLPQWGLIALTASLMLAGFIALQRKRLPG